MNTLDKQTAKMIARIAENLPEMDGDIMQGWIDNPKGLQKFLRSLCSSEATAPAEPKSTSSILEFVSTIVVNATTGKFVAQEKFVCDTGRKARVKISYLGGNFTEWFLSDSGKIEDPISEQTLRYAKLRKASVDDPIITELGGEAKAETTLSEIYALMVKQAKGEGGVLLNNGWANIFYARDHAGVLRSVIVYWDDDGWGVDADPVGYPGGWDGGSHVFSRNSVLESSEPVLAAS